MIFDRFLEKASLPQTFAEIGFGPCDDFDLFLRRLHDENKILYTGYDITKQFVNYARAEYPGYNFRRGGFRSLRSSYDITYTRHTFLHLRPGLYTACLKAMLRATRKLAVISWRLSPGSEAIRWNPDTGLRGAWVNRYDKNRIMRTIHACGFRCVIHEFADGRSDTVYVLTRRPRPQRRRRAHKHAH